MISQKKVYMCFTTDVIHYGHTNIINKASKLGSIVAGVLTDELISTIDRYTLVPLEDRIKILSNQKGIDEVVIQYDLYYDNILREIKPDYVVHGDNWQNGILSNVRKRVIEVLKEWGGELIEFPYTYNNSIDNIEKTITHSLGIPDMRRPRLKRMLESGKCLRVMEAHNGLSGLIVENSRISTQNEIKTFDAMWISSLCDSTVKGKPDIEIVDMTSRLQTVNQIMEVTTKPIIFDGDTGGLIEHFEINIKSLERIGVSAVIIEDKIGLKRNSLFGENANQQQDTIKGFSNKIMHGKKSLQTKDFMLIARIESLILNKGMDDALARAFAYVKAGADGIMIHSRQKSPNEIFEFCQLFRKNNERTPLIVVPSTFNSVTENELHSYGINIIIYANQLLRSSFPAMQQTALSILENERALEADKQCIPIDDIINLIPYE